MLFNEKSVLVFCLCDSLFNLIFPLLVQRRSFSLLGIWSRRQFRCLFTVLHWLVNRAEVFFVELLCSFCLCQISTSGSHPWLPFASARDLHRASDFQLVPFFLVFLCLSPGARPGRPRLPVLGAHGIWFSFRWQVFRVFGFHIKDSPCQSVCRYLTE
jgi:hypothetical protein